MTDKEIIKAEEILDFFDFFNQRAERELWNDKPFDIQNEDIGIFSHKVRFLKDFINRQQAEIKTLKAHIVVLTPPYVAGVKESVKQIKSEAIKEFIEKCVMEFACGRGDDCAECYICEDDFFEIMERMYVGGEDK